MIFFFLNIEQFLNYSTLYFIFLTVKNSYLIYVLLKNSIFFKKIFTIFYTFMHNFIKKKYKLT